MTQHKIPEDVVEALELAKRIHSYKEILEIHTHKTFTWTGYFSPLNKLPLKTLIEILKD